MESVPTLAVDWIHWSSDLASARVHARIGLSAAPVGDAAVDVEWRYGDTVLARTIMIGPHQERPWE